MAPTDDLPGDDAGGPMSAALFTETARKAGVCWLSYAAPDGAVLDRLVWHVWHDGSVLVVTGPGEQAFPPPPDGAEVEVALRSAHTGGLLVRRRCQARTVDAADPAWDGCAAALLAGRLNHGPSSQTLDRWRASASLHLLAS